MGKDYYSTLGVSRNASKEDIKKAYKNLVKQHHPDLNPNAKNTEKIKEINEAYSVLSEDTKRANYDRFGSDAERFSGGFRGFGGMDGGGFDDINDIFESFFEGFGFGGRQKRRRQRGADLNYSLGISFKESFFGVEKKVKIARRERCSKCDGTGAKDGELGVCPSCKGSGMQQRTLRTPFGVVSQSTTCSKCHGSGQAAEDICEECDGVGKIKKTRDISIKVPAGIRDGMTLKLYGEGEPGINGPNGDLFVEVNVEPDKVFEREDNNIIVNMPVSFAQAALGDDIEVPTISGKAKVKIPPGTQSHTLFRLKGKGFPYLDGYGHGDEHIRIIIYTPTKLSKKEKELLEELKRLPPSSTANPSFFSKMKEAFRE